MDRTLTVTGVGSASAVPDVTTVHVAVTHRAESVAKAFDGVRASFETVAATAREVVADAQVASAGLHVGRAYDDRPRPETEPVRYECRHSVRVRCPAVAAASGLLQTLVERLGDRLEIEGLSLDVSEDAVARTAARETAYADALARATHLAGLAGVGLGEVVRLLEGGHGGDGVYAGAEMARTMSLEPGQRSIGASVTVTFALA